MSAPPPRKRRRKRRGAVSQLRRQASRDLGLSGRLAAAAAEIRDLESAPDRNGDVAAMGAEEKKEPRDLPDSRNDMSDLVPLWHLSDDSAVRAELEEPSPRPSPSPRSEARLHLPLDMSSPAEIIGRAEEEPTISAADAPYIRRAGLSLPNLDASFMPQPDPEFIARLKDQIAQRSATTDLTDAEIARRFAKWDVASLDSEEGQRRLREWVLEADLTGKPKAYEFAINVIRDIYGSTVTAPGRLKKESNPAYPFRSPLHFYHCYMMCEKLRSREHYNDIVRYSMRLLNGDYFAREKKVGSWDIPSYRTVKRYLASLLNVRMVYTRRLKFTVVKGHESLKPGVWQLPYHLRKFLKRKKKSAEEYERSKKMSDEDMRKHFYDTRIEEVAFTPIFGPILLGLATENGVLGIDFDFNGKRHAFRGGRSIHTPWSQEYMTFEGAKFYGVGNDIITLPTILCTDENDFYLIIDLEWRYKYESTIKPKLKKLKDLRLGDFRHLVTWHCRKLTPVDGAELTTMSHRCSKSKKEWIEDLKSVKWSISLEKKKEVTVGTLRERTTPDRLISRKAMSGAVFVQHLDWPSVIAYREVNREIGPWENARERNELAPFLEPDHYQTGPIPELAAGLPFVFIDVGFDALNVSAFSAAYQSVMSILFKVTNYRFQRSKWISYAVLPKYIPVYDVTAQLLDEIEVLRDGVPAMFHLRSITGKRWLGIGRLYGAMHSFCSDKEGLDDFAGKRRSNRQNKSDLCLNTGGPGIYGGLVPVSDFAILDGRFLLNYKEYIKLRLIVNRDMSTLKNKSTRESVKSLFGFSSDTRNLQFVLRGDTNQIRRFNYLLGSCPDVCHTFHGIIKVIISCILKLIKPSDECHIRECIHAYLRALGRLNPHLHLNGDFSFLSKTEKTNHLRYLFRSLFFGLSLSHLWKSNDLLICLRLTLTLFSDSFVIHSAKDANEFKKGVLCVLDFLESTFKKREIFDKINIPKVRCLVILGFVTFPLFRSSVTFNNIKLERAHRPIKRQLSFHSNHHSLSNRCILDRQALTMNFHAMISLCPWGPNLEYQLDRDFIEAHTRPNSRKKKELRIEMPFPSPLLTQNAMMPGLRVEVVESVEVRDSMVKGAVDATIRIHSGPQNFLRTIYSSFDNGEDEAKKSLRMRYVKSFRVNDYQNSDHIVLGNAIDYDFHSVNIICRDSNGVIFMLRVKFGVLWNFNEKSVENDFSNETVRMRTLFVLFGKAYKLTQSRRNKYETHSDWVSGYRYHEDDDYLGKLAVPSNCVICTCVQFHDCTKCGTIEGSCEFENMTWPIQPLKVSETKKESDSEEEEKGIDRLISTETDDDDEDSEWSELTEGISDIDEGLSAEVTTVFWEDDRDGNKEWALLSPSNGWQPRLQKKVSGPTLVLENYPHAFVVPE